MYDVIIIGAGAAGLTAATYTCRKMLKTLIVSYDIGGQTSMTNNIENYPGTGSMSGPELMERFKNEAVGFGAELKMGKVAKVEKIREKQFRIALDTGETYESRALILAYGKVSRKLDVPGEDKFMGRGVSTCVTCDAPFFRKKNVAVVGGGNSAIEGVLELAEIASKIYLMHRRDSFRADEITVRKLKKHKNIVQELNSTVMEIKGNKNVEGVAVTNLKTKKSKEIKVDGVFIEIGYVVDTKMVGHLVKLNPAGEVIKNERGETSCKGIFAAGDVTNTPYKQTVISAGEGATAALECYRYLTGEEVSGYVK
ncbi:thioredoxin-disulfide reductase [Candidatus Woesearchaeota archaeon]|nr:thioredoxin-disulfide reductase [Candidatus Woesearchaeota archaeon]